MNIKCCTLLIKLWLNDVHYLLNELNVVHYLLAN